MNEGNNQEVNKPTIEDVFAMLKTVLDEVKKSNEEASIYRAELEETKNRVMALENNQSIMVSELAAIGKLCEDVDEKGRKKNIIVYDFPEEEDETVMVLLNNFVSFMTEKLKLAIQKSEIDYISRMRVRRNEGPRPVLIRFVSTWRKYELLGCRKQLKALRVSVSDDLPPKIRRKRKELIPYLVEARQQNLQAYLRGDKLVVQGTVYTLEQLRKREAFVSKKPINLPSASGVAGKSTSVDVLTDVSSPGKRKQRDNSEIARRTADTLEKFRFRSRSLSLENGTQSPPNKVKI